MSSSSSSSGGDGEEAEEEDWRSHGPFIGHYNKEARAQSADVSVRGQEHERAGWEKGPTFSSNQSFILSILNSVSLSAPSRSSFITSVLIAGSLAILAATSSMSCGSLICRHPVHDNGQSLVAGVQRERGQPTIVKAKFDLPSVY